MRASAAVVLVWLALASAGCAGNPGRPASSSVECARAVVAALPPGLSDPEKHCLASAGIAHRCSPFEARLAGVIRFLERMPGVERLRWLDLLSYIHALVYHVRHADEHPGLWRAIEASVATGAHRQEVRDVGKTMADVLRDQGRAEGWDKGRVQNARETLVRLLRRRFGEVPEGTIAVIESTADLEKLSGWLDLVVTAETLEDVGIE